MKAVSRVAKRIEKPPLVNQEAVLNLVWLGNSVFLNRPPL